MRILQLHNHYGSHSGESTVLDGHAELLRRQGHEVTAFTRSSVELDEMPFGSAIAFFTALYNPSSIRKVLDVIDAFGPDLVHLHNLYPLLSPSVLPAISKRKLPVVMTVHNYRLVCPNGLFYNRQGICERCTGGREWNCLRYDCEGSFAKSFGYSLRNAWARAAGYYLDNVDAFLCLTEFQKRKLIENGFPDAKCHILPNFIDTSTTDGTQPSFERDGFFFIGRLNRQKGADILVEAAKLCPEVRFSLAGALDASCLDSAELPSNVQWLGVVENGEKTKSFRKSRALVFTSRSYEGFPMVFLEAMQHGLPIVAPRLAGYPEVVREGVNGWLYEPEDPASLASTIRKINDDPKLAERYGRQGMKILEEEYSGDRWYREFLEMASRLH
jgi:glycosyltransferase involved in cell wall biosynthesis